MAEHATYFADEKSRKLYLAKQIVLKGLVYLFLTIFALFLLAPFVLMIVGSFVNAENFYQFSVDADFKQLGFQNWGFSNFKEVFNDTYIDNFGKVAALELQLRTNSRLKALFQSGWFLVSITFLIISTGSTSPSFGNTVFEGVRCPFSQL